MAAHLQNQVPGLEPWLTSLTIQGAYALFFVVSLATSQWWAGRGRRKTRQCPIRLVRLTLPGSTTREISLSGGGLNKTYWRLPYGDYPSLFTLFIYPAL